MAKSMKILDCTLRDGGYYTNWDFDSKLVDTYIQSMNHLPVDYLEIGYRSNIEKGYLGEYFYLPLYVMERLKSESNKKLVIILDEKDIRPEEVKDLLSPCIGLIDMVRLAIDPKNFERAIGLAIAVKAMGFKVGFNVMYMSTWKNEPAFLELLPQIKGIADYFYMVDSFGGVYPEDVKEIYSLVSSRVDVPIGFHGHNNVELALINTLTAIECGATIVDATITGMGRGAGNLKTELLLTALNAKSNLEFDFNMLAKVVDAFTKLQEEYGWGTNLPYMVSGVNSLPQKDVMDWVGKRYYSFNSIIRALQNQSKGVEDNQKLPIFQKTDIYKKAIIVGGGGSVYYHSVAIKKFIQKNPDAIIIHASSKNALVFNELNNQQLFCLVGNEGHRMEEIFDGNMPVEAMCVLPPFPRKMGTYIPEKLESVAFELSKNEFTDKFVDSHTAIALQTVLDLGLIELYFIGYDGYKSGVVDEKSQELLAENQYLLQRFYNKFDGKVESLTETVYDIALVSLYSKV
jgi:4-hydroxy 2-oxovalerate aldolase